MRKKGLLLVVFSMSLCPVLFGSVQAESGRNRVFFSLAEAVARPERAVFLVFFSLECHVCWEDLVEMKYFVEKNGIPVELVGVSRNSPVELEEFRAKFQFSHPIVCDRSGELYRRFKVKLEPFKIILKDEAILFEEDAYEDFLVRREKVKKCLLEIASR